MQQQHYNRGTKIGNALLTQIRVGRSFLNQHAFAINLTDSPKCQCNLASESPYHYLLECELYTEERRTLLGVVENFLPKFNTYTKKRKLDIILSGYDQDNIDMFRTNVLLQIAVQKYIIKTKRFDI